MPKINLAGASMGLLPFVGTGLQAFTDAQRAVDLGANPLSSYGIAGARGVAGAIFDLVGPGWLRHGKNATDIASAIAAYGGMSADAVGNKGLGETLTKGAEMLNPDTYVKKFLYSMLPNSNPDELLAKKRATQQAYEQIAAAQTNLDATKSPTLTQTPPTVEDRARLAQVGEAVQTARFTGRLPIAVDSKNIDSLLAGLPDLSRAVKESKLAVNWY